MPAYFMETRGLNMPKTENETLHADTAAGCGQRVQGYPPCPLYVILAGQPVLVIGGGMLAQRKTMSLIEYGADVTVVSPDATQGIREAAHAGKLRWIRRRWLPEDGEDAVLVVSATGDRAVDEVVYGLAMARRQLVNVVDVPELCTVIVPSVVRRGRLQIAISTSGASPSTAREIRRALEREFPEYWETYVDVMADVRALVKQRVPGPACLREPLYEAVRESDVLQQVAQGNCPDPEEVYGRVVAPLLEGEAR
jgi:precorrin-2 dehydrogenase/sirohydrochlorin ferrochelatase